MNTEIESAYKKILDCSFLIHSSLEPGLLESAYQECLYYELVLAGLKVEKQKALPLVYKEINLEVGYRVDLMVNNSIITSVR